MVGPGDVRRRLVARLRSALGQLEARLGTDEAAGESPAPAAPRWPELTAIQAYSLSGSPALENLAGIADATTARGVRGALVECGVWNGGSAAALYLGLRDQQSEVWLYDSFEGLPAPAEVDGPDAQRYTGDCVGSESEARAALALAGAQEQQLVIRKGWFDSTFRQPLPNEIAILHIDADWYDGVSLCLSTFYDRVVDGGVIILDDFGHWEGCREAFYDFTRERGLKPLLERFGHTQAYWIKGRAHNRDHARDDGDGKRSPGTGGSS